MSEKITKKTVISSLLWKFLERGGVQGVQFVLSIILARLVTPDDYGVIALILVFTQIANVFVQSGFNTALIQKKDSDEKSAKVMKAILCQEYEKSFPKQWNVLWIPFSSMP